MCEWDRASLARNIFHEGEREPLGPIIKIPVGKTSVHTLMANVFKRFATLNRHAANTNASTMLGLTACARSRIICFFMQHMAN